LTKDPTEGKERIEGAETARETAEAKRQISEAERQA
jgi:hypothetical protein